MELGETNGDEGSFFGWDIWRGGAAHMGQKKGVKWSDTCEHYVGFPDPGWYHPPTFTLEHSLGE